MCKLVSVEAFYEFCISNKRPGKKTNDEFTKTLKNTLFPTYKNEENNNEMNSFTRLFSSWVFEKKKDEKVLEFLGFDPFPKTEYDFTFFFHPEIKLNKNASSKDLLFLYKNFLSNHPLLYGKETAAEKKIKMIFGLFNNHGAFSNYFNKALAALEKKDPTLKKQIIANSKYWKENQSELDDRLTFLQNQASKIQKPFLTRGWHEYRSSVGGKIESWVSNTLNQELTIEHQLFGGKDEKGKWEDGNEQELLEILDKDDVVSKESKDVARECLDLLQELKPEKQGLADTPLSLYRKLIGELRTQLNIEYQDTFPTFTGKTEREKKNEEKTKRAYGKYPKLFKDIRLVPNFLGETKREKYKKFIFSADVLHQGTAFLSSVDEQVKDEKISHRFKGEEGIIEFTQKQFETLRKKYYVLNATRFQHVISSILNKEKYRCATDSAFRVEKVFLKEKGKFVNEQYYAFFVHPLARTQNKNRITIENLSETKAIEILQNIARDLKPRWEEIIATGHVEELLDAIEMEKVRLGILTALFNEKKFKVEKGLLEKKCFSDAFAYLELKNNPTELNSKDFGRFLQTSVCAEIKGALNKISRTEYTERYVAQPMKAEENFPLTLTVSQNKQQKEKAFWHIIDKGEILKKESEDTMPIVIKAGKIFSDHKNDYKKDYYAQRENIFDLVSSKYHLQFLSKVLNVNGQSWWKKKGIGLSLASYSFILEQQVFLKWDLEKRKLILERNDENKRIFVSIPFTLKPRKKKIDLEKRSRYMGIDVGEYGLAWTILDVDLENKKIKKILKQGFIYEPLTHKIRDYVKTLQSNQVKGTFSMPNTKLERLRENAITSLRNQVSDIAMRYNAIPVYEFEISNFETGSNKVKVIYDSVKRADVGRGGSDADKAEADLVWGKKGKNFGKTIGAYATSYICTKCKNSPYLDFENGTNTKEQLNEVRKLSRPSIEDFIKRYSQYTNEPKLQKNGSGDGVWKTRRGNSAIYICQKCKHVSDADIQASYWIALKKILRDFDPKKEKNEQTYQNGSKSDELTKLLEKHNTDLTTEIKFDLC